MIATAHGTLRTLTKNKDLRDLVGGCQSVTIGDEMAKSRGLNNGPAGAVNKVAVQRSSGKCQTRIFTKGAGLCFQELTISFSLDTGFIPRQRQLSMS